MAGTPFKFLRLFTNLSLTKNVAITRNPPVVPAIQQLVGCLDFKPLATISIPGKPKKPKTAFIEFYVSRLPLLTKQNPGKSAKDLVKLASIQWKVCDPAEKSKLVEEAKKQYAEYLVAKESFETSISPEMKEKMISFKEKRKERRRKLAAKKLGKPVKPLTVWSSFVASKGGDRRDKSFADFIKQVSEQWYQVDLKTKQKLSEAYQQKLAVYKVELDKWEDEMIRTGHPELIRPGRQIRSRTKLGKYIKQKSSKKDTSDE
nr:PREDICTED: ARS-binding factor 2, mitochondrial-like [Bemisia tabaci]